MNLYLKQRIYTPIRKEIVAVVYDGSQEMAEALENLGQSWIEYDEEGVFCGLHGKTHFDIDNDSSRYAHEGDYFVLEKIGKEYQYVMVEKEEFESKYTLTN